MSERMLSLLVFEMASGFVFTFGIAILSNWINPKPLWIGLIAANVLTMVINPEWGNKVLISVGFLIGVGLEWLWSKLWFEIRLVTGIVACIAIISVGIHIWQSTS